MRRIFGNGRRTLAATPAPKRETRFDPQFGGRCPCPRSLKASRKTSPLHRFRAVPGYGACRLRRACAVKRMAEAVSGILPREDKATAMRVLSLSGKPLVSWSGPAVSTLIRKVFGLRRYRPGRFLGEAAMTNAGSLGRDAALHIPHVFAAVMARSRRVSSALRPMAPSMPTHEGSRERRWSRGLPEVLRSRRRPAPRRGRVRRLTPKRRGSKWSPPQPRMSRAPLILRPRVMTWRGRAPRLSCGLRVPPHAGFRLDPDENVAPERVELS
jgi:hypothetical protein